MPGAIDAAQTIPVLASLDITETRRFYVEQLGFTAVVHEAEQYLVVRRDSMELHFWLAPDRGIAENTSCYVRGGQVAALFAEYEARAVPGLTAFAVRPWNMKEFYIRDPHGNLLRFGCAPQELD